MQAKKPKRLRPVHGVMLLDKPAGMTSNEALQRVRWLLKAEKAGHTGALDPFATGLLPLCFGEATKLSAHGLEADKRYTARLQLGRQTDSGDIDGQVVDQQAIPDGWQGRVAEVLAGFIGAQTQVPPMFSALKRDGQKLYQLAHQGIEIERAPRPIHIHDLQALATGDDWLEFSVHCSKGTYVRVLAEDLAKALGTVGHLMSLRRTGSGKLLLEQAVALVDCTPAHLQPLEILLDQWPVITFDEAMLVRLRHGQRLFLPDAPKGEVAAVDSQGRLFNLLKISDDGRVQPWRAFKHVIDHAPEASHP